MTSIKPYMYSHTRPLVTPYCDALFSLPLVDPSRDALFSLPLVDPSRDALLAFTFFVPGDLLSPRPSCLDPPEIFEPPRAQSRSSLFCGQFSGRNHNLALAGG